MPNHGSSPSEQRIPKYEENSFDPRLLSTRTELLETHRITAPKKRYFVSRFWKGADISGIRKPVNPSIKQSFSGTLWVKSGRGSLVRDLLMALEEECPECPKEVLDKRTDLLLTGKRLDGLDERRIRCAIQSSSDS